VLRIRLTRKFAERLNGVDLSAFRAGEVIELPDQAARMLLAEGWAEKVVENPPPMTRPAISPT
jgi:hypothetical protein